MNIVLITPNRKYQKGNIWGSLNPVTPPQGIGRLCSMLEANGFDPIIIDAFALRLNIQEILDKIPADTDIIGITASTVEIKPALGIAHAAMERFPKAQVVMGGVHCTLFHDSLVENGDCHMVVRGEGERALLSLANNAKKESIKNLTWKQPQGQVVVNPMEDDFIVLDDMPIPAYHKLPMDRYHAALGAAKSPKSIGLVTSRGCPGKCTFCYSGMHGDIIRTESAEKVVDHIMFLKSKYGIMDIAFYDDTFTSIPKRVDMICELLLERKVNITWSCMARVDTVKQDSLKLMKRAGCHQICFGFESPDEKVLKAINKKTNMQMAERAIKWTRGAGIDVRGAFMIGNPGESEATIKKTIEYSKQAGLDFAVFNVTTPFPGTEMERWASENGYITTRDWDKYDLAHAVMDLPGVSGKLTEEYNAKAYKEFYLRPSYILQRLLRALSSWHSMKEHVAAFLALASMLLSTKQPEE